MPKRLLSIDVVRAVTMLLMIFVNDVSGVHQIPEWIDHAAADEDRLGFADTIFPAFLFIVGLSLPLALQQREKKGDDTVTLLWYIIGRSAALIIMGFFHVNGESYSQEAVVPHAIWTIVTTLAFFLIWLQYPNTLSTFTKRLLRGTGVAVLIAMAILYKGADDNNEVHGMQMSWWGILGIIGWAYLACSVIYVLLYGNLTSILIALSALLIINILSHTSFFSFHIAVIGDGSSAALVMAGVAASLFYNKMVAVSKWRKALITLAAAGSFGILVGFVIRPFAGGISKIQSTPAWVLICIGISLLAYTLFAWLVDIKGKYTWFQLIKPAGTSTLTCYLLPYFLYAFMSQFNIWYPHFLNNGLSGIIRSFAIAFAVIGIAGLLEKKHIRLKL